MFISYRHADNKEPGRQWATWIHQVLETFEVPSDLAGTINVRGEAVPSTLYPVFRDEEELPADADLTGNIRRALQNSALLLVVCSPRAVNSRFVSAEIRYFKELGKSDRIMALMVSGEPNVSDDPAKQKSGIPADLECLPEPLRFGVAPEEGTIDWTARTEPIAADVRPEGQTSEGWTTAGAYRAAIAKTDGLTGSVLREKAAEYERRLELATMKIIAGALGVPLGTITQRNKAVQLRKAQQSARVLRRWLAAVAALGLLAAAGGVAAYVQTRRARAAEAATAQQSESRRLLLREAARSDRVTAEDKLRQKEGPAAFAYLARSLTYEPDSTIAAEKAASILNSWGFPPPHSICLGHTSRVSTAEFTPDGQQVLSASGDGTACIWATQNGALLYRFAGGSYRILNAHFSPDGKRVLTACGDGRLRIWEAKNAAKPLIAFSSPVLNVKFSPDGEHVLATSDLGAAVIFNPRDGKILTKWSAHDGRITDARFSGDGSRIVTSSSDRTARVWNSADGKLLGTLSNDTTTSAQLSSLTGISTAQFSPDDLLILTTSLDGSANIWDAKNMRAVFKLLGHQSRITTASFSPDGRKIVTSSADQTGRVWETSTGRQTAVLVGHKGRVTNAQFSPDGTLILTAGDDHTARLWKSDSGELIARLSGHTAAVNDAQFSPNGKWIVTASDDHNVRVFSTQLPQFVSWTKTGNQPETHVRFSTDGQRIISGGTVLDADSGNVLNHFAAQVRSTELTGKLVKSSEYSSSAAWVSPGLKYFLAVSPGGAAQLSEANSGRVISTLVRPDKRAEASSFDFHPAPAKHGDFVTESASSAIRTAGFSPDDSLLATSIGDSTAQLWNVADGTLAANLVGHQGAVRAIQFSSDSRCIVTGSDDHTARVWEAKQGKLLMVLASDNALVNSVQFDNDSSRIATGDADGTARTWEARTGKLLAVFSGHIKSISQIAFSADGRRIITASEDGTTKIWDTTTAELVSTLPVSNTPVRGAQFTPDESRVITVSDDHILRIWTALSPASGAPPGWFKDFLTYLAQQRLNANGEVERIPPDEWLALRERLRKIAKDKTGTANSAYLRIFRYFVSD
ncbi:MAG: TIR domain-containing protein [Chthoniobacterales bacterium]